MTDRGGIWPPRCPRGRHREGVMIRTGPFIPDRDGHAALASRHSRSGEVRAMSQLKANLRFAAFIRVSTEQQEKQGESLRTQRTQNEKDVGLLGGNSIAWYGGQEHGTPGY